MPTRAQGEAKMNEIREGVAPTFVEGTESTYPSRADRRRITREIRHKQHLMMARLCHV